MPEIRRSRRQQRDIQLVRLPDGRQIELLRVRDPRARRLRLLVSSRGPRLTIPPAASIDQAHVFVEHHLDWLAAQVPDPGLQATRAHPFTPALAGHVSLRGQPLALDWRTSPWLQIHQQEDRLVIDLPEQTPPATLRRALHDFLVAQARADIGRWLLRYLPGLPRTPRSWRIRPLSSLWGSLSSSGAMSLDLALILAPSAAFDYVLVHELCHLIHANHAPAFWQEVEQRCPDWKRQRQWLNTHGLELKHTLRQLLATG